MDKKFISFPDPDEYSYLLEGLDRELFEAFYENKIWHQHLREKYFSAYANKTFNYDGRYRAGGGAYISQVRYVKQFLEYELNNIGDRMEYVLRYTQNPELSVKCMLHDGDGQIDRILRTMRDQSPYARMVYAKRIIAKGKREAQEGGYSQVFKAAARK